jgi:effector-binding domain-containing protein
MEYGAGMSYDRLEELLAAPPESDKIKLDTPQIVHTNVQLTAVIHLTVPRSEIRDVMGPGLNELKAAVAAQGITPTGPWFTHHLKMHPDTFDFEICLPVNVPVAAAGRVKPGQLPARKVARTVYRGNYEQLGTAWREFDDWIEANGHKPAPDLWECYVTGPETSPNPADWKTQLNRPLVG